MNFKNIYKLVLIILITANINAKADDSYLRNSAWQEDNNVFSKTNEAKDNTNIFQNEASYSEDDVIYEKSGPPAPPDVPINQYITGLLITTAIVAWRFGKRYQNESQ